MSDLGTPYARAQKLAQLGLQPKAIVAELVKDGVDAEEAKLAVHALHMEPTPPVIANDLSVGFTIFGGPGLVLSWNRGSYFDAQIQVVLGGATLLFALVAIGWAIAAPGLTPLLLGVLSMLMANFLLSRILQAAGTILLTAICAATIIWFRNLELLPVIVAASTAAVGVVHLVYGLVMFGALERRRNVMNLVSLPVAAEAKANTEAAADQRAATGT